MNDGFIEKFAARFGGWANPLKRMKAISRAKDIKKLPEARRLVAKKTHQRSIGLKHPIRRTKALAKVHENIKKSPKQRLLRAGGYGIVGATGAGYAAHKLKETPESRYINLQEAEAKRRSRWG